MQTLLVLIFAICFGINFCLYLPSNIGAKTNQIAIRKLTELNDETDSSVTKLISDFVERIETKANDSDSSCFNFYKAMKDVVSGNGDFLGKGSKLNNIGVSSRVSSARSFYDKVVKTNWEQLEKGGTFGSWMSNVTNYENVPQYMMQGSEDVIISYPYSFWATSNIITTWSKPIVNEDYFRACQEVSLAPEWYPDGLVLIQVDSTKQKLLRPNSFHGMESPLWVQFPDSMDAQTGGGIGEVISLDPIFFKEIKKENGTPFIRVLPVDKTVHEALLKSESVDVYSEDTSQVSSNQNLGKAQKQIVADVEKAREVAEKNFNRKPLQDNIANLIARIKSSC